MRSASRIASSTSLVMRTTVFFSFDQIASISVCSLARVSASSADSGSSSSSTSGSMRERARDRDALAHAAREFGGLAVGRVRKPDHLDVAPDASGALGLLSGCRIRRRPRARHCPRPTATAAANSSGTPRRAPARARSRACRESSTSPLSGAISPAIRLISVVLPEPEKPTMATNSPSSTDKRHILEHVGARRCRPVGLGDGFELQDSHGGSRQRVAL